MALQTVFVADKPTLDLIEADTQTLKNRGGIKIDTGDLYGYNPTTSTWQKIDLASISGANPTLIIVNDNGAMNNIDITVTHEDSWFEVTQNMGIKNYITFVLPVLADYTVSYEDGGSTVTETITVNNIGGVVLTLPVS